MLSRCLLINLFICSMLFLTTSALAQPQVEIEFITSFGEFGKSEPGTFDWPAGIALDGQGRIIVADNGNNRIQRCNTQGDCEVFGREGSQLGEFKWPLGVAVDSLERIIVSEAGNDRIQLRDSQGGWTSFGSNGRDGPPGKFRLPAGLAVDDQDKIIIADENNHRIQICDDTGNCSAFGSSASFNTPRDVAVDSQEKILVTDFNNNRVQICSYEGECTTMGSFGQEPGQFDKPAGIAVDSQDRIFIVESGNHRLQICDLGGACTAFGEFGTGPGQFDSPQAVAVDEQDRIYVAELENNRIQIFQAIYADDPPPDSFMINPGLNDAWFNLATDGQGFLITVFPVRKEVFLAWFTFDTKRPPDDVTAFLGEPGHRWLTAQGPYDGDKANLTIFLTEGGVFDAAAPVASTNPAGDGTLTLEFVDCTEGLVNYEITSLGISGEIPVQRISPDNVSLCEALANP